MDEVTLRNEAALVALTGKWSDELTGALAEVARAAATDSSARSAATKWIQSGTAEQLWAWGAGVADWVEFIDWFHSVYHRVELTAAETRSLEASFSAVFGYIGAVSRPSTMKLFSASGGR